jgi:hypothetical protein
VVAAGIYLRLTIESHACCPYGRYNRYILTADSRGRMDAPTGRRTISVNCSGYENLNGARA